MEKYVKHLIVDSGAFIKAAEVHEYAENIYTVSGVLKEIKDKATLQRLQFLPYSLQIKSPSSDSCKFVMDFSKKTGDYSNLSVVDLQILALVYELEKENCGSDHLNTEPSCKVTQKPAFGDTHMSGFYVPKKNNKEETSEEVDEALLENGDDSNVAITEENESDDEDSWLTPSNITEVQEKRGILKSVAVACITTDFCMQNVLIQMGLNVLSVNGLLIKQARVYILRCYSCYKTTSNPAKQFCPNCGNKTLKRVSVTVNDDGSKNIHINFRRPLNIRGTRYSIPLPKGGKHGTDPILFEDQRVPHNRPGKRAMQRVNMMSEDYVVHSSPFTTNDVYSRAAHLGIRANGLQHRSRRNPNESSKRTGHNKK